jgi:hypothetical protein
MRAVVADPGGGMAAADSSSVPIPGLDLVGRGVFLHKSRPYELKEAYFSKSASRPYRSWETGRTYSVPEGYEVNDSPPMPAGQALNQSLIEESWDRFDKRTKLDVSLAVSNAPFSVDVTASQAKQIRKEEDSYYALRTSFIPLWTVYVPVAVDLCAIHPDINVPAPFRHSERKHYTKFFERFGTHYVKRVWVGGKATLAFTVEKSSELNKSDIQAGLKASMAGFGGGSVNASDQRHRERLQQNSECTVFGTGGDEFKLAALSSLDEEKYNEWIATIKENPQVIEFEAVGIWTLLSDAEQAQALMEAYREEVVFPALRAMFTVGDEVHFFENYLCYAYDMKTNLTAKPQRISDRWADLFRVGFERVDAAFVGRHLNSSEGEDLNGKIFFFNRDQYVRWDVESNCIDSGYPRRIIDGWPGVPFDRIDATVSVGPEAVYLFRGDDYVRFNTLTNQVDPGYPQPVKTRWAGITFDRVDAATYWGNGKIYFFRENQYVRYDSVMWRADPGYPKEVLSHYVEDWRFFE